MNRFSPRLNNKPFRGAVRSFSSQLLYRFPCNMNSGFCSVSSQWNPFPGGFTCISPAVQKQAYAPVEPNIFQIYIGRALAATHTPSCFAARLHQHIFRHGLLSYPGSSVFGGCTLRSDQRMDYQQRMHLQVSQRCKTCNGASLPEQTILYHKSVTLNRCERSRFRILQAVSLNSVQPSWPAASGHWTPKIHGFSYQPPPPQGSALGRLSYSYLQPMKGEPWRGLYRGLVRRTHEIP